MLSCLIVILIFGLSNWVFLLSFLVFRFKYQGSDTTHSRYHTLTIPRTHGTSMSSRESSDKVRPSAPAGLCFVLIILFPQENDREVEQFMDVDQDPDANGNVRAPATTASSQTTGTPPYNLPRTVFGPRSPSNDPVDTFLRQFMHGGTGRAGMRGSAGRARPSTLESPGSVRGGHRPQTTSRGRSQARAEALAELGRRHGITRPRLVG